LGLRTPCANHSCAHKFLLLQVDQQPDGQGEEERAEEVAEATEEGTISAWNQKESQVVNLFSNHHHLIRMF